MHDIRAIRDNPEALKAAMLRRSKPEEAVKVDRIILLDGAYRKALAEKETLLARRNAASKEIGQAMAAKDVAKAEALKAEVATGNGAHRGAGKRNREGGGGNPRDSRRHPQRAV